jgi:hypothetical protein
MILIFICSFYLEANTLKEAIQKDHFLANGETGFIEYNDMEYLVSVGVSPINGTTVRAKINAIKAAKIIAQRGLTKFIHQVTITSKEELTSVSSIIKDGDKIIRKENERFIEIIREESDGILRKIIEIGKWKKDNEYFFALGVEK